MQKRNDNQISDNEVLDTLSDLVRRPEFKKAFRLRQLLEHLVNKQLSGEEGELRGYNIGLDVFDKDDNFNPDSDTIVRVQMVRLRRLLERYYLTAGLDDPIQIEIPKGTYVPVYRRRTSVEKAQLNQEPSSWFPMKKGYSFIQEKSEALASNNPLLAALIVGALGLIFYIIVSSFLTPKIIQAPHTISQPPPFSLPTGPSIAVFPFNNETAKKKHEQLIRGLPSHIIHTLTRFKNLFIYAPDTTLAVGETPMSQLERARSIGATYALIGGFGVQKDKLSISTLLLRASTAQIIWSKDYERVLTGDNIHEIETDIAAEVASQLGQPYGIINKVERTRRKYRKKQSFSGYDCVLQFFTYAQHETRKKHLQVRNCLEETIKQNPDQAQAQAALSWMYVDEYRFGFNKKPKKQGLPLDRALSAARMAVRLDPDDAFTHRRLAGVLLTKGHLTDARSSILRALELNPNNADVLADAGWILKNTGDWQQAYRYARSAIKLNPGHPPWYLETPTFYYYYTILKDGLSKLKKGEYCIKAIDSGQTYHIYSTDNIMREVLSVIVSRACGRKGLEEHVRALNNDYPEFLRRPHKTLKDLAVPDELLETILDHLLTAGVRLASQKATGSIVR